MTVIAQILVAAGIGARFKGDTPKQYSILGEKTVLRHSLDNLKVAFPETNTFVIVHAKDDPWLETAISGFDGKIITVLGGKTRTQSVRAGVLALKSLGPDLVFIHDAARPFPTRSVADSLSKSLQTFQSAAPILPVVDAVKAYNHELGDDLQRSSMRRVQTPQGFRFPDILPIYEQLGPNDDFADDIAVARSHNLSVGTVEGHEKTFKITYAEDLQKAMHVMNQNFYTATGSGFDVHRIEMGESLTLCGIEINAGFSLKGHSDADVALHALTDAIYGALADGDIGTHFPPSDPQWKGTESHVFLSHALSLVKNRGGQIQHVDLTIICEKPKISPHRSSMTTRISTLLELPPKRVSVKATTTEMLGFTGRGEGIAVMASATLSLPSDV